MDAAWVPGLALPDAGDAGQAAVPGGAGAVLSIAAVPETRDGGDPTGADTTAVVRVLGTDGAQIGERELTLTPGRLQRLDVAALATTSGATPALVTVDAAQDARVVWGLELAAGPDEALVSTLTPAAAVPAPGAVHVRAVDALG